MSHSHSARGPAVVVRVVALILICASSTLDAFAQGEEQDTTMKWWVVGTGGVFDAANADGDALSGTLGQTAIDSTTTDEFGSGKVLAGANRPQPTVLWLGFWLPTSPHIDPPQSVPTHVDTIALSSHPNPFRETTTVIYHTSVSAHVRLHVVNAAGRVVRILTDERHAAGAHQVLWDGRDDREGTLPNGVYFATFEMSSIAEGTHGTITTARLPIHLVK